jgi:hypothetical protein
MATIVPRKSQWVKKMYEIGRILEIAYANILLAINIQISIKLIVIST